MPSDIRETAKNSEVPETRYLDETVLTEYNCGADFIEICTECTNEEISELFHYNHKEEQTMVKKLKEAEFAANVAEGTAVVDFNATWCGPCKMLAPVLEELSGDYDGKANFYAVDTDENGELCERFGITNIPAVAFVKDGELKEMNVGFVPKTVLSEILDRVL